MGIFEAVMTSSNSDLASEECPEARDYKCDTDKNSIKKMIKRVRKPVNWIDIVDSNLETLPMNESSKIIVLSVKEKL